jgi:hypothetical protein
LKKLNQLLYLIFVLVTSGCQTDSTYTLQKIIVEDQAFAISATTPENSKVGQVIVSHPINIPLRFQLVAGKYSHVFRLNDWTGELFLHDKNVLSTLPNDTFELQVLVSTNDTLFAYGEIACMKINITDSRDYVTTILDATSGSLVNSGYPTDNFGTSAFLYVNSWTVDLQPIIQRSHLKFNLDTLPLDAEIKSAILKLYNPSDEDIDHTHSCFGCTNPFYIRKVLTEWESSSITWSTQPGYSSKDQTIAPASVSENQDYSINVTEIVRAMAANRNSNYGFVLMLTEEKPYRRLCFCSVSHSNPELRPKLEISYVH